MNAFSIDQIGSMSPEQPCGVDLEYDVAFTALQQAATGVREQQFGDALIPAVAPDWRHVETLAVELLGRSVDLRIIALLTQAWTEIDGLPGYAKGLALAAETLEQQWEDVHPQLRIAGEFDPLVRVNAIAALTDPKGAGRAARDAILLRLASGGLSLREAAAILESNPTAAAKNHPSSGGIQKAALCAALAAEQTQLTAVPQLLDSIDRIRQQIATRLDISWVPSASAVETPLETVQRAILASREHAPQAAGGTRPLVEQARSIVANDCRGPGERAPIGSRESVMLALEDACLYLEQAEPSHPAPLLIRRAQRLMRMNFYDIVRDMAPAALPQVDVLAGHAQSTSDNLRD
ncbi:type VI secretion system protein TssA [Paraburkholderia sp. RP-4-7]|uniref:Type VI secretion system protein TssA n=1 Tax=Paraburkholderia polaris TaxID=2728848 RepID=A0A848IN76_9BURK|nr:type VI secretion system protein TssA [Paraburkholderia polaris]NMM02376.1 type VI secretion system protein TssA [Paraburkholderia polaris]